MLLIRTQKLAPALFETGGSLPLASTSPQGAPAASAAAGAGCRISGEQRGGQRQGHPSLPPSHLS